MSALLLSPIPPDMIQERQSASVSKDLEALLAEVASHVEGTASRTKAEAIDAIAGIHGECCNPGWDGYDAKPVCVAAIQEAEFLLNLLPYSISLPHISPVPIGAVAFEWRRGKENILLVTVYGAQKIAYAAIIDGVTRVHGVEPFIQSIPSRIEKLLVENFRATV